MPDHPFFFLRYINSNKSLSQRSEDPSKEALVNEHGRFEPSIGASVATNKGAEEEASLLSNLLPPKNNFCTFLLDYLRGQLLIFFINKYILEFLVRLCSFQKMVARVT